MALLSPAAASQICISRTNPKSPPFLRGIHKFSFCISKTWLITFPPSASYFSYSSFEQIFPLSFCDGMIRRRMVEESESKSVVTQSCLTLCDPMDPTSLLSPMGFPRQEYWVGCCALLQGIFLTQELNPGLLHCRHGLKPWKGRRVHGACNISWNLRPLVNSQLWPQTSYLTSMCLSSLTY